MTVSDCKFWFAVSTESCFMNNIRVNCDVLIRDIYLKQDTRHWIPSNDFGFYYQNEFCKLNDIHL